MSEFLREHPEILLNKTIKKTYQILKLLGKGTFSVVYQCMNVETKEKLAIKVGFPGQGQKMLNLQKRIYRMLTEKKISQKQKNGDGGFPKYYQYGKTQKFSFIVLERLSVSVQDIFVKLDHKFSIKTVLNFGIQAVDLIEKLHNIGYVHRDIKPCNFVLGHGNKKDKIYLIDFGLARKCIQRKGQQHNGSDDEQIPIKKKFIGTKRFASVASHLGVQQDKKDDLESLGYLLIFLLKGRLPWQGIKLASKPQQYETVGKIKQDIDLEEFCKLEIKGQITYNGKAFRNFLRYVRALKPGESINYDFFRNSFKDELAEIDKKPCTPGFNRWKCKGKFDWMDQAESEKESRKGQSRDSDRNRSKDRYKQKDHDRKRAHNQGRSSQKQRYM